MTKAADDQGEPESQQTGLVLHKAETKICTKVMALALRSGHRLSLGQTIRLLIRKASVNDLTAEDFEEVKQSDRRRRTARG